MSWESKNCELWNQAESMNGEKLFLLPFEFCLSVFTVNPIE